MTAIFRSDRPRAPWIVRPGGERVVGAFSEALSDRVNGREIDDVEAEVGDIRQTCRRIAERAAARGVGAARSRKELVPGAKPGAFAIDPHAPRRRRRRARPVRVRVHERGEILAEPRTDVAPRL